MKTLTFELVEWHKHVPQLNGMTSLQVRNFKKKFFVGSAFNAAFPLSGFELPQRWVLDGTVLTSNGDEYEFSWRPDSTLTFSDLIQNSAVEWAQAMEEAANAEEALSIKCVARIL